MSAEDEDEKRLIKTNVCWNIAIVTKTNNIFRERITDQEQDKVSLDPVSLEYQRYDLGEQARPLPDELHLVNTEIDLTVGETVRDEPKVMSTCKYSLVVGLLSKNSQVPKASGHLSSSSRSQDVKAAHLNGSERKLDDKNDLNVGNEIIDQTVTEKESPQGFDPAIMKNLASAVTKIWKIKARNEKRN